MNKERAQSIVDWILRDPQGAKDYSRSETIADVREAFKLPGKECPDWLAEDKELPRIREIAASLARSFAEQQDQMILNTIYSEA